MGQQLPWMTNQHPSTRTPWQCNFHSRLSFALFSLACMNPLRPTTRQRNSLCGSTIIWKILSDEYQLMMDIFWLVILMLGSTQKLKSENMCMYLQSWRKKRRANRKLLLAFFRVQPYDNRCHFQAQGDAQRYINASKI